MVHLVQFCFLIWTLYDAALIFMIYSITLWYRNIDAYILILQTKSECGSRLKPHITTLFQNGWHKKARVLRKPDFVPIRAGCWSEIDSVDTAIKETAYYNPFISHPHAFMSRICLISDLNYRTKACEIISQIIWQLLAEPFFSILAN